MLDEYPINQGSAEDRKTISGVSATDPSFQRRFALVNALHKDALFPDYMTGMSGLSREIATKGTGVIPPEHACLFPLSFGDLSTVPPTLLLHGINDSAVPIEASKTAEQKLRAAGVEVFCEFPEDGDHGFDLQVGNGDIEREYHGGGGPGVEMLRRVIGFLQSSVDQQT
jgi:acetyl esterase/lipase